MNLIPLKKMILIVNLFYQKIIIFQIKVKILIKKLSKVQKRFIININLYDFYNLIKIEIYKKLKILLNYINYIIIYQ